MLNNTYSKHNRSKTVIIMSTNRHSADTIVRRHRFKFLPEASTTATGINRCPLTLPMPKEIKITQNCNINIIP